MAVMSMWVTVWEIVLLAGIGSFLVLLVAIVPLARIIHKRVHADEMVAGLCLLARSLLVASRGPPFPQAVT